ncbi:MAG: low specificity L-threonine aldolase [Blautia sp.]|nr:low specificity L-threonine aldolase [Blautia sp.]
MEGAHPAILERLLATNTMKSAGYGTDEFCEAAREKIRAACGCPEAAVHFLVGGTQVNATVIDAILRPWQGVIAAETGHISTHEAGAIEFGGHKVLTLSQKLGKLSAGDIEKYCNTYYQDENHEHMVAPGMVYISQPTEYGTLYSLTELTAIHEVCREFQMTLYVDGARLAYGLAALENDVTLRDLARLTDVFYIGGTKCGALFGEAVVIPDPDRIPHFFSMIKQHGALLAKGRLLGIQFDTLFTDDLYLKIGKNAIDMAQLLKEILADAGYQAAFSSGDFSASPTNQVFVILEDSQMARLAKNVSFSFWEKYDENHSIIRLATSWATKEEELRALENILIKEKK